METFLQSTFSFLNDSIGPASLGRLLSSNPKASLVSYLILATTSGLDISSLSFSTKSIIKFHGTSLALNSVLSWGVYTGRDRDRRSYKRLPVVQDFPEGCANPRGEPQIYYWQIFLPETAWKWKKLDRAWGTLRSATGMKSHASGECCFFISDLATAKAECDLCNLLCV